MNSYEHYLSSRENVARKKNSVSSWPVSSVGRALHRYRRGHAFNSRITVHRGSRIASIFVSAL